MELQGNGFHDGWSRVSTVERQGRGFHNGYEWL